MEFLAKYIVLDTNVLVSALLKADSIPRKVLDYVANGYLIPLYNEEILREYIEVLSRNKFNFPLDIISAFIDEFVNVGTKIDPQGVELDIPDPEDKVFYELAIEKLKTDETWLVTGNIRHFPKKGFVVMPREMMNIIDEMSPDNENK